MTHVLSIEDNPADSLLLKQAFDRFAQGCTIDFVDDGEDALDYLLRRGSRKDAKRPSLILLDLNLPRRSGREILEQVKKAPDLDYIPVVILTTTTSVSEVKALHRGGASAVLSKPVIYDEVEALMENLFRFWLYTAQLPRH